MSQRSKPPPTAPLLSLASVTPKANFVKRRERKPLACLAPDSARICCPQTNHRPNSYSFNLNRLVQDRHEFSLGHARPRPTAFLRRFSPQTKRIVEDLFYPYLAGTRHSLGFVIGRTDYCAVFTLADARLDAAQFDAAMRLARAQVASRRRQ